MQWFHLGFNKITETVSKSKIGEKNVDFNEIWFLGLMMYEIYMEEILWKEGQFNEIIRKWKEENSEPKIKKYEGENAKNVNEIISKCLKLKYSERMNIEEVFKAFQKKVFTEKKKE